MYRQNHSILECIIKIAVKTITKNEGFYEITSIPYNQGISVSFIII